MLILGAIKLYFHQKKVLLSFFSLWHCSLHSDTILPNPWKSPNAVHRWRATIHTRYTLSWDSCLYMGWNKVQEKSKYCFLGPGAGRRCHSSCSWALLGGSYPEAASNQLLLPFLYWRRSRVISCIDTPHPTSIPVGPFIEDSPVVLRALTRIISKEWVRGT